MLITEYRLDLTVQALRTILRMEFPADAALSHFFKAEHIGSNERALVAETVFGVLRHRLFLEHACTFEKSAISQPTGRRMALAFWVRFGGYNLRELAPLLRSGEDKWLGEVKALQLDSLPLSIQAELPEWVIEKMQAHHSEIEIRALGLSMQNAAPLDLRVNTLRSNRDELHLSLQAEGVESTRTPYSPIGLRIKGKPPLNRSQLFATGRFEVQDEGSQLLGYLLAPKRNDMVVDFCAGAGGKTLMLGAMMNSQGRLYAWDVSEKRLAKLKPRLARSGLSNVQPQLIAHENDSKIKRLAGKIDRVLVDAPCSGLGTLRRNPDLKFRQSVQSVVELTQKQASILAAASKLVKVGGRLVYATCSILHEENQAIVESFLAAHPDFNLLPASEVLEQQKIALNTGNYLQLAPAQHGTDGFFAAVLVRVPQKLDGL
jgi:16S rRNA (cytosine967-C5)-methyltransferase